MRNPLVKFWEWATGRDPGGFVARCHARCTIWFCIGVAAGVLLGQYV